MQVWAQSVQMFEPHVNVHTEGEGLLKFCTHGHLSWLTVVPTLLKNHHMLLLKPVQIQIKGIGGM